MALKNADLPYLIYRVGWMDGRPYPIGIEGGDWERGDDGWARHPGKRRRRWVITCAPSNGDPSTPIVKMARLDDIRALEALRWRTMEHVREHLSPRYDAISQQCRELGDGVARFIADGFVYKVTFGDSSYANYERVEEPSNETVIEKIARLPTENAPEWKVGAAWSHAWDSLHSGYYRTGRVTTTLQHALRIYIQKRFPKIARSHNYAGKTFRFIINGRRYDVNNDTDAGERWPRLDDIVVDLDANVVSRVES